MEILNVGGWELLMILFLGLLLFGPRDLVRITRTLGRYIQQAQQTWQQFAHDLDMEISAQERRSDKEVQPPSILPPEMTSPPGDPSSEPEEPAGD
jgi:Sec-independent protein translocase protein TatA